MSGQEEESKKKRGAERQLTKDEYDAGNEDEDTADVNGEFKKANAETLAKRRIVKVKRPAASEDKKQQNPFSAATLTKQGDGSKSVFGAAFKSGGFGGKQSFGSGSSGFGSAASSTNNGTSLFGGGGDSKFSFGASKTTSLFGAGAAFSKEGTSTSESSKFNFGKLNDTDDKKKKEGTSILPENVEVSNGEEGEECLMEVRVRSFEWVKEEEREGPKSGEQEAASMAVFSADKNDASDESKKGEDAEAKASKETKTDEDSKDAEKEDAGKKEGEETATDNKTSIESTDATKGGEKGSNEADGDSSEKEESKKESQETDPSEKEGKDQSQSSSGDGDVEVKKETPRRWREMGIGPLRVLKASSTGITRVVQRRENAEGGIGTKVLVNALLQKESRVTKQSEKHLQLATVGSDGPALYLLKVKTQDLSRLYDLLTTQIEAAKSAVA